MSRKIVVDGKEYRWSVTEGKDGADLGIYCKETAVYTKYRNLQEESITPSLVREKIEAGLSS